MNKQQTVCITHGENKEEIIIGINYIVSISSSGLAYDQSGGGLEYKVTMSDNNEYFITNDTYLSLKNSLTQM